MRVITPLSSNAEQSFPKNGSLKNTAHMNTSEEKSNKKFNVSDSHRFNTSD